MHLGHLPPGRRLVGVVGGLRAGSLYHTRPQQSSTTAWGLPADVSPSTRLRRRRGRRCQQSESAPTLHPDMPGRPPHRRAGLLLPQWRQAATPHVAQAGAPVVRPGGEREEDPGVPPLQHLADGDPIGPELGANRALDDGQPDRAVHELVVSVPPPIPRPGEEVPEPSSGARAEVVLAHPHRWWGAVTTGWPRRTTNAARRGAIKSQSALHMQVLVCICSAVPQNVLPYNRLHLMALFCQH